MNELFFAESGPRLLEEVTLWEIRQDLGVGLWGVKSMRLLQGTVSASFHARGLSARKAKTFATRG